MTRCKNANRYQAVREPKCLGGNPCDSCRLKWAVKLIKDDVKKLKSLGWKRKRFTKELKKLLFLFISKKKTTRASAL